MAKWPIYDQWRPPEQFQPLPTTLRWVLIQAFYSWDINCLFNNTLCLAETLKYKYLWQPNNNICIFFDSALYKKSSQIEMDTPFECRAFVIFYKSSIWNNWENDALSDTCQLFCKTIYHPLICEGYNYNDNFTGF